MGEVCGRKNVGSGPGALHSPVPVRMPTPLDYVEYMGSNPIVRSLFEIHPESSAAFSAASSKYGRSPKAVLHALLCPHRGYGTSRHDSSRIGTLGRVEIAQKIDEHCVPVAR
jgi:hypothetical protein